MGSFDQAKNKVEDVKKKGREYVENMTDADNRDEMIGKLKEGAEQAKDKAKEAINKFKK